MATIAAEANESRLVPVPAPSRGDRPRFERDGIRGGRAVAARAVRGRGGRDPPAFRAAATGPAAASGSTGRSSRCSKRSRPARSPSSRSTAT